MLLQTLLTVLSSVSLSVSVNPLGKDTCNWSQQSLFIQPNANRLNPLHFELRHLHAVSPSARVVFSDVSTADNGGVNQLSHDTSYAVGTRSVDSYRPPESFVPLLYSATRRARRRESMTSEESLLWKVKKVPGPDVESRETLLHLAKMSNNAYVMPEDGGWYDLGDNWEPTYPVGWEPEDDGFRGHVFATQDNSTIVLSIKGTSSNVFGGGGPTVRKDKRNDNLLFSCCCAHVDWTWKEVCGCHRGGWKCDYDCTEDALVEDEDLFYPIGINLYNNLTYMYPDANVWVIGHSLGGSIAALLGATFGVPVVAFEAPGEAMAASRLHLPTPPSRQPITHVYHTADPIPMGTCNGMLSSCSLGGYAMESRCHLGKSIIYDTVSNLSWSVDVRTHGILIVIERILSDTWPPSEEIGREVPKAVTEDDCVECYRWEYGSFP